MVEVEGDDDRRRPSRPRPPPPTIRGVGAEPRAGVDARAEGETTRAAPGEARDARARAPEVGRGGVSARRSIVSARGTRADESDEMRGAGRNAVITLMERSSKREPRRKLPSLLIRGFLDSARCERGERIRTRPQQVVPAFSFFDIAALARFRRSPDRSRTSTRGTRAVFSTLSSLSSSDLSPPPRSNPPSFTLVRARANSPLLRESDRPHGDHGRKLASPRRRREPRGDAR